MNESQLQELGTLALHAGLLPHEAMYLPSAIGACAKSVGVSDSAFLMLVKKNRELREYVMNVCKEVAVAQ